MYLVLIKDDQVTEVLNNRTESTETENVKFISACFQQQVIDQVKTAKNITELRSMLNGNDPLKTLESQMNKWIEEVQSSAISQSMMKAGQNILKQIQELLKH